MRSLLPAFVAAFVVVLGLSVPALADFAAGEAAYKRGDYEATLREWRPLAEQGDAQAQFYLGDMYTRGLGVAKDDAQAFHWYRKAAEQGVALAQHFLGVLYINGQGIAKDDAEAARWYRQSAEQGFARAQYDLALMYETGRGVQKDKVEALRWLRKAAENGFDSAQMTLGRSYETGNGVKQDFFEAVRWYRKAAEQGVAVAQLFLGHMYETGSGIDKDEAQAARWYRMAAEQGEARAQHNLGALYGNGQGVTRDDAEAARWFRKAAVQGYARAQSNLGGMYTLGQGVPQDYAQAVKWYRKAAEQGDADAQFNLGLMYYNGQGVAKDDTQAFHWYRKAAEQGGEMGKRAEKELKQGLDAIFEDAIKEKAAAGQSAGHPASPPPKLKTTTSPSRSMVMAIQKRLADLGYGPGPADGIIGSGTRAAIQAFQAVAGLAETGEASRDLMNRLNKEARAVKTVAPVSPSAPAAIPAGLDFGRYFALVIGNDKYRSLPRLKTAVADAQAVARILKRSYGFETTVLTNATRDGILDALDGLRRRLTKDDNLLIYYAGHGWLDRDANPSRFQGDRNPVKQVSWDDAQDFVRRLGAKTGKQYRLLTEAEWEYAARAGTATKYPWGVGASHEYANYGKDRCCGGLASGRDRWVNTSPVGSFSANAFGLHDMHGNVDEWVDDCWHDSYSEAPTNGSAWASGGDCRDRVLRGGSWGLGPWNLRSASRLRFTSGFRLSSGGFRVARTLP